MIATPDEQLRPEPIADPTTAFYWEGAAAGELRVQTCDACQHVQFPPNVVCENCRNDHLGYRVSSGRGTLYAKTVMHQAFHPAFAESLPVALCLVDLDDAPGIRLLTNLVDVDAAQVETGAALRVVFEQRGASVLPQFTAAGQGGGR